MPRSKDEEAQPVPSQFAEFISRHGNSAAQIQAAYALHRTSGNSESRTSFLSPTLIKLPVDPYLQLTESSASPYGPDGTPLDPRNSLVLWARPPEHVLKLAAHIQSKLQLAAPHLWLMPTHRMHATTFELAFSRTAQEITSLLTPLRPYVPLLANFTFTHRTRLVKPLLSYDLSGVALSFLPACGEPHLSPAPSHAGVEARALSPEVQHIPHPAEYGWPSKPGRPAQTKGKAPGGSTQGRRSDGEEEEEEARRQSIVQGDPYTYHHLRDSLATLVARTGVPVTPRYNAPSAHITLARYATRDDHATTESRRRWVAAIDEVNDWLQREVWDVAGGEFIGEWVVGQERGLDLRCGTAWYGGGRSIMVGEGF